LKLDLRNVKYRQIGPRTIFTQDLILHFKYLLGASGFNCSENKQYGNYFILFMFRSFT